MPLPTLAIKGSLRSLSNNAEEETELSSYIPYQYIIQWITRRQTVTGMINRVLIVKAETASGKSTLLPGELYRAFVHGGGTAGVLCTQPRTLTAIKNVLQILTVPNYAEVLTLGANIGWSTRFNKLPIKSAGIMSVTIGTLRQQLMLLSDAEIMDMYKIIIIDEVHERDIDTDITLYLLKKFLVRNESSPRCPYLLLSSATMNTEIFAKYFELISAPSKDYRPGDCFKTNVAWCSGRSFGITEIWDWNSDSGGNERTVNNYPFAAADVVKLIVEKADENKNNPDARDLADKCDILIFFPGLQQMLITQKPLEKLQQERIAAGKDYFIINMISSEDVREESDSYRTLDEPLENNVLEGATWPPMRRVIMSTNIAETGLTINSLKYVIDAGFNKETIFYAQYGASCLITAPAPVSRITQRKGRAGRLFPGVFYPLYPKFIYDMLQKQQFAQISVADTTNAWLGIIYDKVRYSLSRNEGFAVNMREIDLIEMPPVESARHAVQKLYTLGYISYNVKRVDLTFDDYLKNDGFTSAPAFSITQLGILAAQLSLIAPENVRMILSGYFWGVSIMDLVSISAYTTQYGQLLDRKAKSSIINWLHIYETALGHLRVDADKLRVFINDGFIDGIVLITAVRRILRGHNIADGYIKLLEWCNHVNINKNVLLQMIRERDDNIEQLYKCELAAEMYHHNSLELVSLDNLASYITAVKHCIHDGYRMNLLKYNGRDYYTTKNVKVRVTTLADIKAADTAAKRAADANDTKPQRLLYHKLDIKQSMKTNDFLVSASLVSMMDGFVNYDDEWLD